MSSAWMTFVSSARTRAGRPFRSIPTEVGLERIKAIFPYAVGKPAASGYVSLGLNLMPSKLVLPGGGIIRSTLLPHGNESTLGLVFEEPSTGMKSPITPICRAMTEKYPRTR